MVRKVNLDCFSKFVLLFNYLRLLGIGATLSIYSASVYPPDSPYTYLLSGNTLFETVYSTFNSSGILAIGGILLAAGGKLISILFLDGFVNFKRSLLRETLSFYQPPPTPTPQYSFWVLCAEMQRLKKHAGGVNGV